MPNRTLRAALAATALAAFASPALSAEHEILIVDGAYFPPLIYVNYGDNVVFVNNASSAHEVKASDDSWTSGLIPLDGSFTLEIEADTYLAYQATADTEGMGDEDGDIFLEQFGEVVIGEDPGTEANEVDFD